MKRLAGLPLAAMLLLAGCGRHAPPAPAQDNALAQAANSGRQALSFGHPSQAASQYQRAFTLALARNDASAIGDCGYDLAVAQLADDKPADALRTTLRTRDALAVRATPGFAELDLAQAAALHRLGRDPEADALAASAQAAAGDPATAARASYVRGLIAYARRDPAGIAAALDGFGQPKKPAPDWQADHDELTARLDMLRGQYQQAGLLARQAAGVHRLQLDYRGMADMLALAAEATQRAGSPREAASLYLQAGQSEAARGSPARAGNWLRLALMPGADLVTQQVARQALVGMRRKDPVSAAGSCGSASGRC